MVRERIGPLKDLHGPLCVEPQKMDEIFKTYFSSGFTVEKIMEAKKMQGPLDRYLRNLQKTGGRLMLYCY